MTAPTGADPRGQAVLVTGCSSGIGRASALALLATGRPVYATARRTGTLSDLAAAGATTLSLDVTDEASMQAAVDRVVADHGAVGVLVNNAGYGLQGPIETTPMDAVRTQFETNVFGLVRLTQLALPGMRERRWGRVVNMSSMGGRVTFPGGGFYHASKHAVEAISDALRYEVAPFGIGVALIEPGPVRTAFGDAAVATIDEPADDTYIDFMDALRERIEAAYDGRRTSMASSPERVAKVVVRAVQATPPRPRYVVGPVARAMVGLRRFAPAAAFDGVVRRSFPVPVPDRASRTAS